ncbi:MAG TPA: hypothetical protein VE981_11050 [Planctomycetota bacterium]|nr:hypothetical protein [Planctomycetota bacterium]
MPRTVLLLAILLASCGAPPSAPAPAEDLALLLGHPDPARREEGAARLSIRGITLPEALAGRDAVLSRTEADTDSLRQGIERAAAETTAERLVWRAWHELRLGCLAREWRRIFAALPRQGFRLIEVNEPDERSKFVRYAASAAYVNPAGDRHSLFFWVRSCRRDDGSWIVREVYAGLHVPFDGAFKMLAARERYPRASLLGGFFELPDLPKVAAVFPILEELEFTYGRIRDKAGDSAAAGFHVNAGFAMEGKAGGRSLYYTAESGLDPREGRGGVLDWESFTPSETTGPWVPRGSGIWGAGGLKPSSDQ